MMIRGLLVSAVTAVVAAAWVPAAPPAQAAQAAGGLRVGTQVLSHCGTDTYCGTLRVPLDWQLAGSPDISVCYQWYPATGRGAGQGNGHAGGGRTRVPVDRLRLR